MSQSYTEVVQNIKSLKKPVIISFAKQNDFIGKSKMSNIDILIFKSESLPFIGS